MSVCSALDSDRLVLAALNQAVSVGFAPKAGAVLYSSESFSLTVPLPQYFQHKTRAFGTGDLSSQKQQHAPGSGGEAAPAEVLRVDWRFDLDEGDGEVLEIMMGAGGKAAEPEHPVSLASLSRNGGPLPTAWESRAHSEAHGSAAEPGASEDGAPGQDGVPEVHGSGMALGALQEQGEDCTVASARFSMEAQRQSTLATAALLLPELPGISLRLFSVRSKAMVSEVCPLGPRWCAASLTAASCARVVHPVPAWLYLVPRCSCPLPLGGPVLALLPSLPISVRDAA